MTGGRECWACGSVAHRVLCDVCDAPAWTGVVSSEPIPGAGVYLLAAECGMWKIGVSKTVASRTGMLIREAARSGEIVAFVACLPDAGRPVEMWLHDHFALNRDIGWAKAERLPHHTEWFWPARGLAELACNGLVTGEQAA